MNKRIMLLLIICVAVLTGCSNYNVINNNKDGLEEYINNHGVDYSFVKDIDYKVLSWGGMIDKQGNLYDIVSDKNKTFSNNLKYKKRTDNPTKYEYGFYGKGNYIFYNKDTNDYYCINGYGGCRHYTYDLNVFNIDVSGITDVNSIVNEQDEPYVKVYYLNGDGNIYLSEYKYNILNRNDYTKTNNIYLDSSKYGKIIHFEADYDNPELFKYLLTDKGLYKRVVKNKEDVDKYEDVAIEYTYELDERYEKIKDRVIYNDLKYIMLDNYKLYEFYELMLFDEV